MPNSREGKSGFTWAIYEHLIHTEYETKLLIISNTTNESFMSNQLDLFALKKKTLNVDWNEYRKIFIYPDTLLLSLPEKVLNKTIVFAPDATSMARWSKYKAYKNDKSVSWIKKLYQYLLAKRFICFEDKYIEHVNKYIVVGINDRRWLRKKLKRSLWSKILYLPHPLVKNAMIDLDNIKIKVYSKKRFVFSGDMSYSYVGQNIAELSEAFNKFSNDEKLNVLVVGGHNKWVSDILCKSKGLNVTYIKWVDDYKDICQIGRDVHCVPLIAGAGTKNRVLTALANGLEVISTPKGVENIRLDGLTHVFVKKRMYSFAQLMLESAKKNYLTKEIEDLLIERKMFRQKVQKEYFAAMKKILF